MAKTGTFLLWYDTIVGTVLTFTQFGICSYGNASRDQQTVLPFARTSFHLGTLSERAWGIRYHTGY